MWARGVFFSSLPSLAVRVLRHCHYRLQTGNPGTSEWATLNVLWEQHSHGLPHSRARRPRSRFPYVLLAHPTPPPLSSHALLGCLLAGTVSCISIILKCRLNSHDVKNKYHLRTRARIRKSAYGDTPHSLHTPKIPPVTVLKTTSDGSVVLRVTELISELRNARVLLQEEILPL